jgi:hypothetical protein
MLKFPDPVWHMGVGLSLRDRRQRPARPR